MANRRRAGQRLISAEYASPSQRFTKQESPRTGQAFGPWEGRLTSPAYEIPGGNFLQFNLDNLRLSDYRQMTLNYQINSSLMIMTFMQHQAKWHIQHPDKKVRDFLTESLQQIWTQLTRTMSQANWAGYSPGILEWDNYVGDKTTRITKVKDMIPEECQVNWKSVDLYAPPGHLVPKGKSYDGIKVWGQGWPVPTENTMWYPLLMQNGDYYGRKLLKSVYTSYFFSMLLHLYANRYYERFGEPTPIGRAPFDDDLSITVNGETKKLDGTALMMNVLQNLRSRGVVMLPSDRVETGNGQSNYEYDIDYLESQMRGADFERYMIRLDQEMSLGLFTPLLLQQTAEVGSYNLGRTHYQMYLNTQNALNDDKAFYIDWYILWPLIRYNFSKSTVPAKIVFEKQDEQRMSLVQTLLQALMKAGTVIPDLGELGQAAGLTLYEVEQLTAPIAPDPNIKDKNVNPDGTPNDAGSQGASGDQQNSNSKTMKEQILQRMFSQASNQYKNGFFSDPSRPINVPFTVALKRQGLHDVADELINFAASKIDFTSPEEFRDACSVKLDILLGV